MKRKNVKKAAPLIGALAKLPKVGKALTEKPGKYNDAVWLSLTAAEMNGGVEQGATYYCAVPAAVGRKIVAAAEKIIKRELKILGVK